MTDNRRQNRYVITSQSDLVAFFSDTLPKTLIKETIRQMKIKFVKRPECTGHTNKIQFLKKCEWELVRMAKAQIAAKKNMK